MGKDWQYAIPFYGGAKLGYDVGKDTVGMWRGDKERLSEIEQKIAESSKSPYNTMQAQTIPVTQELRNYYDEIKRGYANAMFQAKQGMSDAEMASYQSQINQQQNLAQQTAQMAGGGGAGAYINSVLGTQTNRFNLDLAAKDQEIKRQNRELAYSYLQGVGNVAGQMQDISTRQTMLNQDAFAKNFEKQMLMEQALGQAKQDWYSNRDANRQGIMSTYTNLLGTVAGMGGGGGGGAVAAKNLKTGTTGGTTSTWKPKPLPKYEPITASSFPWQTSDIRLKQDIVFSHQEKGYKIYEFSYKSEPNVRYSGVLAQEVLEINPDAVISDNGYYKVDYHKLGLTMKKLD
jgi:hypothetical protein